MTIWRKPFVHNERLFEAVFTKVPHREMVEASVHVLGQMVKVRDREHNEQTLIQQLKAEIDRVVRPAA